VAAAGRPRRAGRRSRDDSPEEAREELGIDADFSITGERPVFLTVTRTVGLDPGHTDVSLWYVLSGHPEMPIMLDPREFADGRWWTAAEIDSADPALLDPHFGRLHDAVDDLLSAGPPMEVRLAVAEDVPWPER
jgi:8-oxo-dGTP diphosphatase